MLPDLVYPLDGRPADGEAMAVAPGVFWVRMPIAIPGLDFINLYLIEDGDGWTVVDTGLRGKKIEELWRVVLGRPGFDKPVNRVICTHFHPDHIGQAGWFEAEYGAELWMTWGEWTFGRLLALESLPEPPQPVLDFYMRAGLGDEALAAMKTRGYGNFGKAVMPIPRALRRIVDGEVVRIGNGGWTVIVGQGHSPEHACLYNAELNLLISGDQILPRISPHVGVYPGEPEADPLHLYLSSLSRFDPLPDDVLVLPAHGDVFRGLKRRVRDLQLHHDDRLDALVEALATPKRAIDTLPVLFRRELKGDHAMLGLGEALAHLHLLMNQGRVTRSLGPDGVDLYAAAA